MTLSAGFWAAAAVQGETPACAGDCDGDASVTIDELIKGVNIVLGSTPLTECPPFDGNADREVTVDELVKAVSAALSGCEA